MTFMRQVPFVETADLLERYQIPLIASSVFDSREKAWGFIQRLDGSVAMKIDAADVWHRTEQQGVFLDIRQRKDFDRAWDKLTSGREIRGVIVQEMFSGLELSLGVKNDSQFGPVVMFGLGGIMVELLEDVSFRIAPFDEDEAKEMIGEIRGYKLLTGFRGRPPVDQDELARILVRLGVLAAENPDIEEIDLNPVMAGDEKIQAVDAKIWVLSNES